jgi:outer membrane protein insertion porin family
MRSLIPILVVVLYSLPLIAQVNQIEYEGQPVAALDLVTDPRVDVQNLQALVEQKAGQPYSKQEIDATVAALNRTGIFTKVDVQVEPETAGLHVMIVMEPAYYYGVMKFPGAAKAFPYTRLLQVVNLPDQDPYQAKEVEKAQTALADFLRTNGYFQAQVRESTELDKPHGLANVIFQIELGRRAKIGSVRLEGPTPQEASRLLRAMRSLRAKVTGASLKPGKIYTPERVKAGTHLLQQYLIKHDHLASHIQVAPPQYHSETNRADLTISVDEGPTVVVRVTGARLSWIPFLGQREKRKLIPIYQEGSVDPDLVDEGKRNLVNYYQGKGYFDVQVNTKFQQQDQQVSLVYQVDKGKKHKVEQIAFRGNQRVDQDELAQHIAIKKSHLLSRGKFSEKLLRQSVNDLKALYLDRGYEEASITPEVVDKEPKIDVTFQITEGPQTQVAAVNFHGNQSFAPDALSPQGGLLLQSGKPFSPGRLSKDRGHILAVYLDHGYLRADVKTKVDRHTDDPHKVDITYQIDEGQQVQVSQVAITGQGRTRPRFISKTAGLQTETPLKQGKLLESESELYNLGIFDWASVGPRRPITDQTEEEAVVKVHEARRNAITYGFGLEVSRRGGSVPSGTVAVPGLPTIGLGKAKIAPSEATFVSPRGSIEFTRRNMRGLGETGSLSVVLARLDQRFLGTYAGPHFLSSRWSYLFSLSAERTTENPLFAARLEGVSYQLERPINKTKTTTAQIRYSFKKTDLNQLLVPQLVLPEDRSVRLSTFSGSIIRDTRDKPLDAHRGLYQTIDLGITGKAIGASANFGRLLGQTAYYKEVGHGIVWANSIRLGLAKAYGDSHIPTSERFFSGGGTTLRGFPINGAGPQRIVPVCSKPSDPSTCVNITVPVGGNQLFILNSEMRFPMPIIRNLGGVLFYDGGNVYDHISFARFYQNYTNTVGFGFRYNTPVGPVRIDIGRNLNPVPGFRATQFFITLGQAF